MVKIHPRSMDYKVHSLIANEKIGSMKKGDMKDCLILEMTDKRYAVMGWSWTDYFYVVMKNLDELNETFNEQLQVV